MGNINVLSLDENVVHHSSKPLDNASLVLIFLFVHLLRIFADNHIYLSSPVESSTELSTELVLFYHFEKRNTIRMHLYKQSFKNINTHNDQTLFLLQVQP